MCNAQISSSELVALFDAAMHSGALELLYLDQVNDFDEIALAALATLMKRSKSITHYSLCNSITDADVSVICDALANNNVFKKLGLVANGLGLEGARTLGKFLKANKNTTSWTCLDLSFNPIGGAGTIALVDGLKSNTSLRTLKLGGVSGISDDGAFALASLLQNDSPLQCLNLMDKDITEAGLKALTNALKQNQNLQSLNGWSYPGEGREMHDSAFLDALQSNVTLIELGGIGSSEIKRLLLRNKDLVPAAVRRAALFLIGIRRSTDFEEMGDFSVFPIDIVRLIAQKIWATRRDPAWIQAVK